MRDTLNRRSFLANTAKGAGTGLLILPSARTAFSYTANEQLNLAVVGISGYGAKNGFALGIHTFDKVRFGLSCDVDLRKVQRVYDAWDERVAEWAISDNEIRRDAVKNHYAHLAANHPPLMADFRRMLDEKADEIDAVVVATPDHTHANISAAALRAGKPVFTEKPLTIAAHEARALHKLAKETGLPTQMNNHGAQHGEFRRGVELIREGALGAVEQVHVFFSRGGRNFTKAPQGSQPVPKELSWELWLAQVAHREYHEDWINRIAWRETSIGELGNFGPHSMNMAFMALNIAQLWNVAADGKRTPIQIESECSEVNHLSYPRWERIRWRVPARLDLPPVTVTWHHGHKPDYARGSRNLLGEILLDHGASEKDLEAFLPNAGCIIFGEQRIAGDQRPQRKNPRPAAEGKVRRCGEEEAADDGSITRPLYRMGASLSGERRHTDHQLRALRAIRGISQRWQRFDAFSRRIFGFRSRYGTDRQPRKSERFFKLRLSERMDDLMKMQSGFSVTPNVDPKSHEFLIPIDLKSTLCHFKVKLLRLFCDLKSTLRMFIGRTHELKLLRDFQKRRTAGLVVCRGRRRIGKSTLIEQFGAKKRFFEFYGLAPRQGITNQDQLDHFGELMGAAFHVPPMRFANWHDALSTLAGLTAKGEAIILLDEISWIASKDRDFPGKLKGVWDTQFKKKRPTHFDTLWIGNLMD